MNWKQFWIAAIASGMALVAVLLMCAAVLFALIGTLKIGAWVGVVFILTLWIGLGRLFYGWKSDERTTN